jgi:hypothetical protein
MAVTAPLLPIYKVSPLEVYASSPLANDAGIEVVVLLFI